MPLAHVIGLSRPLLGGLNGDCELPDQDVGQAAALARKFSTVGQGFLKWDAFCLPGNSG